MTTVPPRQSISLNDVISKMRGKRQGTTSEHTARNIDWDTINGKLANAVEFKTNMMALTQLDSSPVHNGGSQAQDLASLITALGSIIKGGQDPTAAFAQLMQYVQSRDERSVKEELAELRHELTAGPSGNPTLETLQALGSLGLLERKEQGSSQHDMLDMMVKMRELGMFGPTQQVNHQPSFMEQLDTMLTIMDRLRPAQPPAPSQTFQLPNGLIGTFDQLLALEELKDKRDSRVFEARESERRSDMGREMFVKLTDAFGEAAAALREQGREQPMRATNGRTHEQPAPAERPAIAERPSLPQSPKRRTASSQPDRPMSGQSPAVADVPRESVPRESVPVEAQADTTSSQSSDAQLVDVKCDYCGVANGVDVVALPDTFVCSACGQKNQLEYN